MNDFNKEVFFNRADINKTERIHCDIALNRLFFICVTAATVIFHWGSALYWNAWCLLSKQAVCRSLR